MPGTPDYSGEGATASDDHASKFVFEELAKRVTRDLGPGFREHLGPDREILDRISAVCPQTYYLLRVLPKEIQLQVVKEVVANARTRWPLAGGFRPHSPVSLGFELELDPLQPRDPLRSYGIYPNEMTDGLLLKFTKKTLLAHSNIPAALRSVLTRELDDSSFLTAFEILKVWPQLATAVLELRPTLRARSIQRFQMELPERYTARGEAPSWASDEKSRLRLARLASDLVHDEKTWPNLLAALDKRLLELKLPLATLHELLARQFRIVSVRGNDFSAPEVLHPGRALVGVEKEILAGPRRLRFLTVHGSTLSIQEIELPGWAFLEAQKPILGRDLARLLGPTRQGELVLFLGGGRDYSTHDLLPGRLSARSFDDSARFARLHMDNLRHLVGRTLAPESTVLFNLLPASNDTLRRLGLPGSERHWQRARRTYDALARHKRLILDDGTSRQRLLGVLRDGVLDSMVIVARSEQDGIFLSDGSKVDLEDILDLPPLDSARKPVIILVSARPDGLNAGLRTVAQALLVRGRVSAVLAPTRKAPMHGPTVRFLEQLVVREERPATPAFSHLSGPWQLYA